MSNKHLTAAELDDVAHMIDDIEVHRMGVRLITDKLRAMPRGKSDGSGDDCAGHAAILKLQRAADALNDAGDQLLSYRENINGEITRCPEQ